MPPKRNLEDVDETRNRFHFKSFPRWKIWVLANFEFMEKSVLLKSEILELVDNEMRNAKDAPSPLSAKSLTLILSDIWNGRVKLVQRVRQQKRQYVYLNLKKKIRAVENSDINDFESLVRLTPPAGWVIIRNDSEFLYLKLENKTFQNQRQVTELSVKLSSSGEITYGVKRNSLFVEDLKKHLNIGSIVEHLQIHEQVTLFLELFSRSSPCSGIVMDAEDASVTVPHVIRNYDQSLGTDHHKIVAFAVDCKLIVLKSHHCSSCTLLKKNYAKRKKRKEGKANEEVSSHHNNRFLTRDELLLQLKKVQSQRQAALWQLKKVQSQRQAALLQLKEVTIEKNAAEQKAQYWKEKFQSLSNCTVTNSSDGQDESDRDKEQ